CFPEHVRPVDLSGLIISHAHLDHIGASPLLYITGRIPVYLTKPTLDLARLLIIDFLKISSAYVDYDISEFGNMVSNAVFINYGVEYSVDDFTLLATSAGHILGSSMIYLETPSGHNILYTGDVNTINTWTLSAAELWPKKVDTLIIESTYGDRKHPSRHFVEKQLVNIIEETVDNNGVVLIPAFSIGRSQEVMSIVQTEIPHVEVYLDGMSCEITNIYLKYREFLRDPALFEKIVENTYFVRGWSDRRKVWRKPCVIIASAGMLKGGPSVYYLKKLSDDSRNSVVLVSYQAPNSPGFKLLSNGGVEEYGIINLKPRLYWLDLSSHAGKDGLLSIIKKYRSFLKNIVLIHGETESIVGFKKIIRENVDEDVKIHTPVNGDEIELFE
ncbi:MAG: MBL fold metallo-hydrolase, partial [Desulfurococcaceae archaeon]